MDDTPGTSGLAGVGLTEEAASLLACDQTIELADPLNETSEEVCKEILWQV